MKNLYICRADNIFGDRLSEKTVTDFVRHFEADQETVTDIKKVSVTDFKPCVIHGTYLDC